MNSRLRHVRATYLLALGGIALLTILSQALIQGSLREAHRDAEVINVAGRQRMLSQRLAKDALAQEVDARGNRLSQMERDLEQLESTHTWLLRHSSTQGPVAESLHDLEPCYAALMSAGWAVASSGGSDRSSLSDLLAHAEEFLPRMNAVVAGYQDDSDARVARLKRLELIIGAFTLLLLILEAVFIFEPLRRRLHDGITQLEEAREAALASSAAKDSFLATMSHEIRTPLNGVIGMNELLQHTELDPDQRDLAEACGHSAENLVALLNDVLDYAKLSSGSVDFERIPFELLGWFESAIAPLAFQVKPGVEVLVDMDVEFATWLTGDPKRLSQVIQNLTGNAAKFTEEGHVLVRLRNRDGSNGIHIQVEDTGIGIPPDRLESIFERFSQVDASTTRRFGGTGLGLAIVRELVHGMGGTIEVTSEVGRGTVFDLRIPLPLSCAIQGSESKEEAPPDLSGKTLWCVDDHPVNRRYLVGQLESWGAQARSFEHASAALEALEAGAGPPHALLLDGDMPGMNGIELARRLSEDPRWSGTPRVLLSSVGLQEPEDGQFFDLVLFKPLLPKPLARTLAGVRGLAAPAAVVAEPAGSTAGALAGLRVLAAEDNPVNRRILASHLEHFGCEFELVENGRACLDRAADGSFDVLLMDIRMPLLDGCEATRELRALTDYREVPIVALTANAHPEDRERYLAAGMNDHLPKPFKRKELERMLRRWCRQDESSEAA